MNPVAEHGTDFESSNKGSDHTPAQESLSLPQSCKDGDDSASLLTPKVEAASISGDEDDGFSLLAQTASNQSGANSSAFDSPLSSRSHTNPSITLASCDESGAEFDSDEDPDDDLAHNHHGSISQMTGNKVTVAEGNREGRIDQYSFFREGQTRADVMKNIKEAQTTATTPNWDQLALPMLTDESEVAWEQLSRTWEEAGLDSEAFAKDPDTQSQLYIAAQVAVDQCIRDTTKRLYESIIQRKNITDLHSRKSKKVISAAQGESDKYQEEFNSRLKDLYTKFSLLRETEGRDIDKGSLLDGTLLKGKICESFEQLNTRYAVLQSKITVGRSSIWSRRGSRVSLSEVGHSLRLTSPSRPSSSAGNQGALSPRLFGSFFLGKEKEDL